jgi:lipid-binding SYLF domain-containing protein
MKRFLSVVSIVALGLMLNACSTTPKTEEDRSELLREADTVKAEFRAADSEIARQMDNAYGMAVFPTIGKGGLVVGGAGGRGVVYEQGRAIGYTTMSQATVGLQAGGQSYSQLILFENKAALDRFTAAEWAMSAQATAVAAASGAGATAKYKEGVMVYVLNMKGLMGEASVGGQKFNYQPM